MDKFRMMFQFLQSNQESFMNGICGIMALASAQMYSAFEFSCPCMPEYNYSYGIGLLIIPPIWFFMLGFVLNNNVSVLAEEWHRPMGKRTKDTSVLRYMFCSITQRSLIAPAVWVSVTLMDGKSFVCAFSINLDIDRFGNATLWKEMSETERIRLLAKIPCKDLIVNQEIRVAASQYIKCISQACGWTFLLLMTFAAFLIRAIRPCFTQAAFLKTKYWSHYIDIERKMFDETCKEHAKSFAKVCIHQYFENISGEMRSFHHNRSGKDESDDEDDHKRSDEEKLLGIRAQDDMNKVLWNWHSCKPALALRKDQTDVGKNGKVNGEINGAVNGPVNGHTHGTEKREWAVYYSKV
ncbi:calcium homeostasis modulator protein 1 [Takifugu rubripes]|uniref:Calcium homeostasis modulator 1 n=1 Tax=Takifugu rubripes TaxID=31033 RepID=H2UHH3_TAKRU|nr:calcium homeostasis modulator protein 1 [Takifugu rubripes]|eukprot:XP_011611340.1 PREDICTED: calcium homeostasis modulator protein 1 [Takifugu rubripes]